MTKQEYQAWKTETESSRRHWILDPIFRANRSELLFYKGGENGYFIWVTADGGMTLGKYEGAIPHIGEALFLTAHVKQFPSQNLAVKALVERAGLAFLLDLMGCGAYES